MNKNEMLLTETELELMLILWKLGEGTVHAVRDTLPEGRSMAYTSASTIIRILEKKGFVQSRKEGKAHIYAPTMSKAEYEGRTLNHVVGRLFGNTPSALVARLIDNHEFSEAELAELKKLLDNRE